MPRILAAAALCCLLSACASTGTINGQIAQTSATLAKQCATVAVVIAGAEAFNHKPKVARALAAAEAARAAFCAAPPADEASAVLTLGTVVLAVQSAIHS